MGFRPHKVFPALQGKRGIRFNDRTNHMSLFFVHSEATGRVHRVAVPLEVKSLPAQAIFAWLRDEVARREAPFPIPDVPGAQKDRAR